MLKDTIALHLEILRVIEPKTFFFAKQKVNTFGCYLVSYLDHCPFVCFMVTSFFDKKRNQRFESARLGNEHILDPAAGPIYIKRDKFNDTHR